MKRQLTITGDGHQAMLLVDYDRKEKVVIKKTNFLSVTVFSKDFRSRLRVLWEVWKFTRKPQ